MPALLDLTGAPRRGSIVPGSHGAGRDAAVIPLIALAAVVVRLPFLAQPLSPDEGGYLLVASQWSPGSSVYGSYFVDRPPLLIAWFGLADRLGGAVPLRLLGAAAVLAAVLAAGRLGGRTAAVLAAAFLSTPLFDGQLVDGELLAVPFVLVALVLLLRSLRGGPTVRPGADLVLAGALATCAAMVKQNMVDALVAGAVLLLGQLVQQRSPEAARRVSRFGAGAVGALGAALGYAALHGTRPMQLWDALVRFRVDAAAVISASASSSTSDRFHMIVLAGLVAGVPLVLAAALASARRPGREPLLWWAAAAAVLGWEATGALLGGSYWQHYLIALVPGLVLLVAAAGDSRWLRLSAGYAATCAALALVLALMHPLQMASDTEVAHYVASRSGPGDTMVVAFGHPDIVREAGLPSPYEHLWSLTARVRDPRLSDLTALMRGPIAPRWIVVSGDSLATWGIDATRAQQELDVRYRPVMSAGDWHVFELR